MTIERIVFLALSSDLAAGISNHELSNNLIAEIQNSLSLTEEEARQVILIVKALYVLGSFELVTTLTKEKLLNIVETSYYLLKSK